jgi:hypothetical protein
VGDQAERVEEARLVRMVLDAGEVEPERLGPQHRVDRRLRVGRVRDDEGTELERRRKPTRGALPVGPAEA